MVSLARKCRAGAHSRNLPQPPGEQEPSRRREIVAVVRNLPVPRFSRPSASSSPGFGIGGAFVATSLLLRRASLVTLVHQPFEPERRLGHCLARLDGPRRLERS